MRPPLPVVISDSEEPALRQFMADCSKEEDRRALTVLFRVKGLQNAEIASMLGVSKRSVQRWLHAYREKGIAGLKLRPHPGRPPRISSEQKRLIAEGALTQPTAFGYLKNEWSISFLARHLSEQVGITISKSHLCTILHQLGGVYKRPKAVVKSPDPNYEENAQRTAGYKRIAPALKKKNSFSF